MAAAVRPETSLDGSLYELVARGAKDTFFFKDDVNSAQPFDYRYNKYPAVLPEIRKTVPITTVKWGLVTEFEFDFVGDLLKDVYLYAELPSWLPQNIVATNGKTSVRDLSGNSYGYVNGIGFFLYEKIQIFQDTFLLQEMSGDALYATTRTQGSYNGLFLDDAVTGVHDGSVLSIQHNATSGVLKLRIPFPGCSQSESGMFPICCVRDQKYRMKVYLRPLERLIECSDSSLIDPSPFGKQFKQTLKDGSFSVFTSYERRLMPQPTLYIETCQYYVPNEYRVELNKKTHTIPFRKYYENIFSFGTYDYSPLDKNAAALVKRRLDGQFLVERSVSFFRTQTQLRKNNYSTLRNISIDGTTVPFFDNLTLFIAGQPREGPWPPFVWGDIMQHAKEERATSKELPIMNWGYGWRQEDTLPAKHQPAGGINFTTADRPIHNVSLLNIPPDSSKERNSEMRTILETWAVYEIVNNHGRFKYAN